MSADVTFKLPAARPGLSLEPAKRLVMSIARQAPSIAECSLLGPEFQKNAISMLIGEVQDALEAYAKAERERGGPG